MILIARRAFVVLVLWVIFILVAVGGFIAAMLRLVTGDAAYAERVFAAMDRTAAVVLGVGDGTKTVSAECSGGTCRFCRVLCAVLSFALKENHCEQGDQWQ